VRAFKTKASSETARIEYDGKLKLDATAPGTWAKNLRVRVEKAADPTQLDDLRKQLGLDDVNRFFNVRIRNTTPGAEQEEVFFNVTAVPSARQIKGILAAGSFLMRGNATDVPAAHTVVANAADEAKVWTDPAFSTPVTNGAKVEDSDFLTATDDFGKASTGSGMFALDHADLFNLLVIPPDDDLNGNVPADVHKNAATYCATKRALYVVDPPTAWDTVEKAKNVPALKISGETARYAAVYFPRVRKSNPLKGDLIETFTASGMIAGIMARTDTTRGVWKAPAGVDAALSGVDGLALDPPMNDLQNGLLNPLGVNCLRFFPIIGHVVWGARTLRGADLLGDEYKYVPVRRTANFIEESLFRGLKWVVFEPNDEPLWAQIRLNVGAFMQGLFRQGAFQGTSARDAYFVACDKSTTTQNDINLGIVNVVVGFAPLKPAEFVVLKIQQIAGQIQT
jgi:phage tail sheath protein FI